VKLDKGIRGGIKMNKMKRAIIKWAMKLFERVPSSEDLSLNEIFCHKSFTLASNQERERIMQKSSEFRCLYEYQHPFDSLFGFDLAPLLRGESNAGFGVFYWWEKCCLC
jgi:hypothetical protein